MSEPLPQLCERARSWAAVAPDGELSELEQRLFDAHVARCGDCRHFAEEVAVVAADLRAAALQPLLRPVSVPASGRPRVHGKARLVGAALTVVALALGIVSPAPLSGGRRESFQLPRLLDLSGSDAAQQQALRDLRRDAIVAAVAARNRPPRHFGNQPAE